ncbi:xanthine and Co dehydrogenase maturation factor [Ktedonobacter sp. SOSP1-85]|uniref:XdhC family protein n=1 Tax=Ktedonobacter sp. SOSP1-85 TaxID=2778367 RepID=UPI0019166E46|nr:XdhC family protein [Ktedonobacter sp. SOSP1-85]GHO73190.1 xanthine and Co dehydrogenase maturation factor [Ktedonobacter sp. SOSP1-85]
MSEIYTTLKSALDSQKGAALATLVQGPEHIGAKLLFLPGQAPWGTLGSVELDQQVLPIAERATWSGTGASHTITLPTGTYEVFVEGFAPPPTLIIVGAGHIAIPLTTFAKTLNYRVIIVDARAAFATSERFPHADEIIVEWPDEALQKLDLNPSTAVAVLTHDPKFDEPTLKVLLAHEVGYIGAIGSRKTGEERAERLKNEGITEEQLQRIHGPIGLNIGAKTPEEIALAIMAEIVATRNGKDSKSILNWQQK